MERLKETLYDVLGVGRNAKSDEIGRAYNRYRSALRKEATPPDPRREVLMHEAFEVLSDPQKREAYDASLRRNNVIVRTGRQRVGLGGSIIFFGIAGFIGIVIYAIATREVAKPPRPLQEIQTAASLGVGQLQSIEISGAARPIGVAFTLAEGVMVTPCAGLSPDTQLVVNIPPRKVPARVMSRDPRNGFCKLLVDGGGSWPLMLSSFLPKPGDKVYAADVRPSGEVILTEGTVKQVLPGAGAKVVEASVPVGPAASGRPLLDADGRVIAVAMVAEDGRARHVTFPPEWLDADRPKAKVVAPEPEPAAPETPGADHPHDSIRGSRVNDPRMRPNYNVSPEQQKRLEKAFRPPPTVPDDL
ncbi:MAG TPA: DnaJ domain-containing protein [Usitatibacter sp.]|nr:DnaJ domain-containing protein [Usitatibacter sp.]